MTSHATPDDKSLEKVYQEASQWVRLANTIIWSMGTLLVPVSFGFVGLALNNSGTQFSPGGKAILAGGSVFLFSFWVYASRIYKLSSDIARNVLIRIEKNEWKVKRGLSLYRLQNPLVNRKLGLFPIQIATLGFRRRRRLLRRIRRRQRLHQRTGLGLFPLQLVTLGALVSVWALILCGGL
jgi:hypothetical protein